MGDDQDPNVVNNDEDEGFSSAFDEFAAARSGAPETVEQEDEPSPEPEGNDPEEHKSEAPAEAAADADAPPASVTSGDQATGAAAPEAAPDPWAQAPAELRELYERERKAREQAEHRARSDAARVAALSRKLATTANGSASAPPAANGGGEPTEAQKALDAKIAQLKEDFPAVADPLIELIQAQRDELSSVKAVLNDVSEERQAAVVAAELSALEERHPDWREVASAPEFGEWLVNQPPTVQALSNSWDAKETGAVLTLFKLERGMTASQGGAPGGEPAAATATDAKRARQLEGGADVRSKPAPATSGAPNDFEAAFAHFSAKKDQQRSGLRR